MDTKPGLSLYQRLGGYDVIAAIVDDFMGRMREDPTFQRFAARSLDSRNRARQLLVDQVCALSGGPCLYVGRDMKSSHAGLVITAGEWAVMMKHAEASLGKFHVPPKEQKEFLEIFTRFEEEIVEEKGR